MHKYAYQSPEEYRPDSNRNYREAATKPYMGITAFLRNNEPWLVISFDGKNHVLESRDGNIVKLNTSFNWVEATDKSRLVAAIRSEGSAIPGTPHYSFEEGEWYIRIEDNIYDPEDLLEELEKTSDFKHLPDPGSAESISNNPYGAGSNTYDDWKQVPVDTCTECGQQHVQPQNGSFNCPTCGHEWNLEEALDHDIEQPFGIEAHTTQKKDDRKKEKSEPKVCPECGSHTTGNRLVGITAEGKGELHCKSCGHVWAPKDLKLNPKMTYQVDDEGKGNYSPGPDDENKIGTCTCGYNWAEHHKFQVGDKSCPNCGHELEEAIQNAGAPGDSWKRSTFENATQDSMSGHDTGAPIKDNTPTEYDQATAIKGTQMNVSTDTPVSPQPIAPPSQLNQDGMPIVQEVNPNLIEEYLKQQNGMPMAASAKEGSWKEEENYEPATGSHKCSNCEYFKAGYCSMFDAEVKSDYVCDEWESNKHESHVKIARKAFTPAEQKSLIEENMGVLARNHSKLNLENTHYVFKTVDDDDPELSLW